MNETNENREQQELTREELKKVSGGQYSRERNLSRIVVPSPGDRNILPNEEPKDGGATGGW